MGNLKPDFLKSLHYGNVIDNIANFSREKLLHLYVQEIVKLNNNSYYIPDIRAGLVDMDLFLLDLCHNSLGGEKDD